MPLYRSAGGTFILKKYKRLFQFKKHFKDGNAFPEQKTFLNTPQTIIRRPKKLHDLRGAIISVSNAMLHYEKTKLKTIFIGHGSGDKKYDSNEHILETYDYHFISGPKHEQKLRDVGIEIPEERRIKVGSLRFDDYVNGKIDLAREQDRLGITDRSRKTVLYAPTWRWGNGTLHKYARPFAEKLTKEHNLIIRPHSHDRKYIPQIKKWVKAQGLQHVYFSNPADIIKSDTMNDFLVSDIMISDVSSILYEYLITNNPIIVARNEYSDLHEMPDSMNVMKHVKIYEGTEDILNLVNSTLNGHSNERDRYNTLLHNCFYFNDGSSNQRAEDFVKSII